MTSGKNVLGHQMQWHRKEVTVEEATSSIIDYRGKTPPKSEEGVRLLTAKVIKHGFVRDEPKEFISHEIYSSWMRRGIPRQGDVLLTVEAPLGEVAAIRTAEPVALAQRVILLRGNPDVIDQDFLLYLMQSPVVQGRLKARSTGTTVLGIKQSELRQVLLPVPDLESQRNPAAILRCLDDLVECNLRRIEILEKAARLVYREWFVHFRYPGHEDVPLVDSSSGSRPENWSHTTLGAISELSTATADPSEIPPLSPVLSLGDLPYRSTTLHDWDSPEAAGSRKTGFKSGDLLFARLDPGSHKAAWAPIDGFCSTDILAFRATEPRFASLILSVVSSDHFVAVAAKTANGTTHIRVSPDVLVNYPVPMPPTLLLDEFDRAVRPMVRLCSHLAATNRCLRRARDLLLPHLVSGDLDISDLDLSLEAVG